MPTRLFCLICGAAAAVAFAASARFDSSAAETSAETNAETRDAPLAHGERRAREAVPANEPNRSPVHLVLAADESWLVTANRTAGTCSLVSLPDGTVLDEVAVGADPVDLALCPDGRTVLVTASRAGELVFLEVVEKRLTKRAAVPVSFEPWGLAVSPDGRAAYVAESLADRVAVIDVPGREVIDHIAVGRFPRYLAVSPDGTRLAVGTSADRGVTVVDLAARKQDFVERFGGINIGRLRVADDGGHVYFPWMIYGNNPISRSNIQRGWVLASRVARVRLDEKVRREAIALDPQGKAVADPHGIDITGDGGRVVVSSSGTRELLVFRLPDLPFMDYGGPGDHIDPELLADKDRFFRIPTGGRPMGLVIAKDGRTVYVANYLDNSVQVVDLDARQVVRTMALGGPREPSSARRGEAIFYDARRSLDQWYSCHSCHDEGGGNVEPMDTQNDGSSFTFKTVLPLFDLEHTAPYTWHGWQKELDATLEKSMIDTMQAPPPSARDVADLRAFLASLERPRNPHRSADGELGAAARRGKAVFEGNVAGCAACHDGPHFTDGAIHDVGIEERRDRYRGFNTPSLVGVHRKHRLLHDGRARTLEEVLAGDHAPEKVTGNGELTAEQLRDLIAYLRTL
ncbi:MAG: cytochrome c peroxidase [Planctomycetaceae bacterium]